MWRWVGDTPTQECRVRMPSTQMPLGTPAAYWALDQTLVCYFYYFLNILLK